MYECMSMYVYVYGLCVHALTPPPPLPPLPLNRMTEGAIFMYTEPFLVLERYTDQAQKDKKPSNTAQVHADSSSALQNTPKPNNNNNNNKSSPNRGGVMGIQDSLQVCVCICIYMYVCICICIYVPITLYIYLYIYL
jgi:hypothetical protein